MKNFLLAGIIASALFIGVLGISQSNQPRAVLGGLNDAVYQSTTTPVAAATVVLKTQPANLGSVVVTKTDTGTLNIYNATTSNVNLRTGNRATSTLLIVSFPTGATAGTYKLDANASDGLLFVTTAGFASSTITWK